MLDLLAQAGDCIARCRTLALHSEEFGFITRTFLSEPMHRVHSGLGGWMRDAGMSVRIDAAGNLRGEFPAKTPGAPVLLIGSHLDTVPHAGAFDGILGVVLAVKLIESIRRRLRFGIEVIGFSEEEGVRFGIPFIGSRALTGELDRTLLAKRDGQGTTVEAAIRAFGLDPGELPSAIAHLPSLGYLEFHIEQGPVLESFDASLGIVEAIAGQSRLELTFEGRAAHAGTTPMHLRRDALAGAAEWIAAVEAEAVATPNLVATVGRIEARPGASNVIPGAVNLSLDVRHRDDMARRQSAQHLISSAKSIALRRGLQVAFETRLDQPAVAMETQLSGILARAVERSGHKPHRIVSGAGHDAMVLARHMPAAMLFLRSPGGISHHPGETVLAGDVAAALDAGIYFLDELEVCV
ncbi:MAG: allantoate amidohydrolase [Acidobacteriota bacterium]|nr:allantoate amidohydrolase [Acidobacteriota bacterium]